MTDTDTQTTVVLDDGHVRCVIDPALGGAMLALSVGGRDILRPVASANPDILQAASFPMVPFANRIDRGRFRFDARDIVLPADTAAPPHALHGCGWRSRWSVAEYAPSRAALRYDHLPGPWPWAFTATQTVALADDGVSIALSVENLSDTPMPCGLGFHPYFLRDAHSMIATSATRMLTMGVDNLPVGVADFAPGAHLVSGLAPFDTLLLGGGEVIHIKTAGCAIVMRAPTAYGFHLYVPSDADFFCVEPVSHAPNAFQNATADMILAPGKTSTFVMTIEAPAC